MSLYHISLIVFFVTIGLAFVFGLNGVTQLIAGIAAFVCAGLLAFNTADRRL